MNAAKIERINQTITKILNTKALMALRDGCLYILPMTLVGSIFLLLSKIPYWNDAWTNAFSQIYGVSYGIMGIVMVFGVAYSYAKHDGYEPLSVAFVAFASFLGLNNSYVSTIVNNKTIVVNNAIDKIWLGGQGMITGIVIGLLVAVTYSWLRKKNISIRLPESVPEGVANQFNVLIPGFIIWVGTLLIYLFFKCVLNTTFNEWLYNILQLPLQHISDSLGGLVLAVFLKVFLFFFGVHGAYVVGAVTKPLYYSNALANQELVNAGIRLSVANGAHIATQTLASQFTNMSGQGITIGLVLAMIFRGKSSQSKSLGKLSLIPTLCNINEPVIYGFPILLNPIMFIPFVLVPAVTTVATYFMFQIGFLTPYSAIELPFTVPIIINALILQGWHGALWQIVIIGWSFCCYLPFFKKQDAIYVKQEQAKKENKV